MRKQKSIFVLETINAMTNRYPKRKAERVAIGYFSTLAKAEEGLQNFVYTEQIYEKNTPRHEWDMQHVGYTIYEKPVDLLNTEGLNQISARTYTPDGKLLDEFLTPDDAPVHEFKGRPAEKIRFHKGDIVEVACFSYTELCIVDLVPITPERVAERRERAKKMYPDCWEMFSRLDYSDDCYLVYCLGEGDTHWHPLSCYLFPPSRPVSKNIERQLREKLAEMDELHKDEYGNGSHE